MTRKLLHALRWALVLFLCLSIPSALADPINSITGSAVLDTSSPRVWKHVTAVPTTQASFTSSAAQYMGTTASFLYGCVGTATCTSWEPIAQVDPNTDGQLTGTNTLAVNNFNMAFNGTTWDRLRTASIGDATSSGSPTGILASQTYLVNKTTGFNERAIAAGGDAIVAGGIPAAGLIVFNGTTWDRVRSTTDTAAGTGIFGSQGLGINTVGNPGTAAGWNQLAAAGALSLTGTANGSRFSLTVPASTWSVTNTPATATQATASRAAGAAGVRHVATTVSVCIAAGGTAQTPILVNLRDGATGAGTILRSWAFSAPVNTSQCSDLSGMAMLGTAATAMTIEFAAAGVASSQQTVTLTGFSTQ